MSQAHTITWTTDKGPDNRQYPIATCSCGAVTTCSASYGVKAISKHHWRQALNHVKADSGAIDVPMQLVGRIIKTRVTNEVWIMSRLGEVPHELETDDNSARQYVMEYRQSHPWEVVIRNSHTWKRRLWGYRHVEQAYGGAQEILDESVFDGHKFVLAHEIDIDTISLPGVGVSEYLNQLAASAREMTKPKDLVELRDRIVDAQSMIGILESAKKMVGLKLLGLDPDDFDDDKFTTYQHTPEGT